MSLKLGTQDIAGISQNTKYNAHHLLDFKWTDCIMNDVSWLRADTFSWQSGDVYTSAYNHLVADLQGITAETETIGSYTVTFYRATDGHKICLADQETTVANIYSETGIAWYYILDTTNTQFKLPRTKYGFEGLRTNVGDKIDESLPNITGGIVNAPPTGINNNYGESWTDANGALYADKSVCSRSYNDGSSGISSNVNATLRFDASLSSSTYQNDAPVQERATQMYLYFYVGDYSQTAIEQTAGLNSELFNGKVDLNLNNMNPSQTAKDTIIGWGIPDYSAGIKIVASNTEQSYTCPSNGFVIFSGGGFNGQYSYLKVNDIVINNASTTGNNYITNVFACALVSKNDVCKFRDYYNSTAYGHFFKFFPLKGVN